MSSLGGTNVLYIVTSVAALTAHSAETSSMSAWSEDILAVVTSAKLVAISLAFLGVQGVLPMPMPMANFGAGKGSQHKPSVALTPRGMVVFGISAPALQVYCIAPHVFKGSQHKPSVALTPTGIVALSLSVPATQVYCIDPQVVGG